MVATSSFLALESSKAEVARELQEQVQQQSALLARDILQLHLQMRDFSRQFTAVPVSAVAPWVPTLIVEDFPMVEKVALLATVGRGLIVQKVLPLRLGSEVVPLQDLSRQPAVAALYSGLSTGAACAFGLSMDDDPARLLALYPVGAAPGNGFILLWFRPQLALPPLANREIVRTLLHERAPAVAGVWSTNVRVQDSVLAGEQRYWLTLERPMRLSDMNWLLCLPLLLVWLLTLGLLLVGVSFHRQLLQGQQAKRSLL